MNPYCPPSIGALFGWLAMSSITTMAQYSIPFYSIDAGGVNSSFAAGFTLQGVVGQTDVGLLAGNSFEIEGGFLNRVIGNRPPVTGQDIWTTTGDGPITIEFDEILSNDSDLDFDTLRLEAIREVSLHGGTVERDGFTLTYHPPEGFRGIDVISYTVGDGLGDIATGSIIVEIDATPSPRLPAGNISVTEFTSENGSEVVDVTSMGEAHGFAVSNDHPTTRGNYRILVGGEALDDLDSGFFLTSVAQNGVDWGEGVVYGTSSLSPRPDGYTMLVHQSSPSAGKINLNGSAIFFPFADTWLSGFTENSATELVTGQESLLVLNPLPDQFGLSHVAGGVFKLRLPGVDARTDGVLLVNAVGDEGFYACSRVDEDGGWTLYTRRNNTNGASYELADIAFVFVPTDVEEVVLGRVDGEGAALLSKGGFDTEWIGHGTYRLSIPSHSPESGTLLLSAEGGIGANVDNILSYQANGDHWIVQVRDLPGVTLQNNGQAPTFTFVFFPALTPLDDLVSRLRKPSSLKIWIPDLLENDQGRAGEPLTFLRVEGTDSVLGGQLSSINDQWIVYIPPTEASGELDQFNYRVVNEAGEEANATVVIQTEGDWRPSRNVVSQVVMSESGRVRIRFLGIPQRRYRVQFTEFLDAGATVWTDLSEDLDPSPRNGSFEVEDVPESEVRFYRVIETQ